MKWGFGDINHVFGRLVTFALMAAGIGGILAGCMATQGAAGPVTVTVAGDAFVVRRTHVLYTIGVPAPYIDAQGNEITPRPAPDREDPSGRPSVAILGSFPPLGARFATAEAAVILACGLPEPVDYAAYGFDIESGSQPGGAASEIFYPLALCPMLDDADAP